MQIKHCGLTNRMTDHSGIAVAEFSSDVIHFLCGDWSRAMVDKSIDHENDVMVAQLFCFFSFSMAYTFYRPSSETTHLRLVALLEF